MIVTDLGSSTQLKNKPIYYLTAQSNIRLHIGTRLTSTYISISDLEPVSCYSMSTCK